jgi:ACS family hexuronate transporter-like MFS transporter
MSDSPKIGNYRWRIVALLFFATTINYIDRQVLSLIMIDPGFKAEFNFSKSELGYIDAAFKAAYALGFLVVGSLIDKFGTRIGFIFSITFWSLAAMSHALANGFRGFAAARFGLGLGESGHFPGAVKTIAEWFPKKERSFATGVFNSGANIGAIAAPLMVPFIALNYGWRWAFLITGAIGFIWLIFWYTTYKKPEDTPISKAEFDHIKSDNEEPVASIPWIKLFPHRQTWAFAAAKFFCDPIWWFYLTWLPTFFNDNTNLDRKLDLKTIGIPFLIIYIVSDLGSIVGGWFSSYLIKRGWSINSARKTTMLICALCVVPIFYAAITNNFWVAIALISLATAAHQANSANVYTLVSDMFPKQAIASVTGIGGMFGAVGGVLLAAVAGVIIERTGSYVPMFAIGGSAYLIGLGVVHLLAPKLEPIKTI